jgi:hypothetical protein
MVVVHVCFEVIFGKCTLVSVLWDDVAVVGHSEALWSANPRLAGFFKAYLAQQPVLGWCKAHRADLCV